MTRVAYWQYTRVRADDFISILIRQNGEWTASEIRRRLLVEGLSFQWHPLIELALGTSSITRLGPDGELWVCRADSPINWEEEPNSYD